MTESRRSISRTLKRAWLRPVIRLKYGFWPQRYWSHWDEWHPWF